MPAHRLPDHSPLRVAVVGCGAVTKASLMPVLAGHDRIEVTALVDRDQARARGLAEAYHVAQVLDDVAAVTREIADAAVLATPPAHHAPATLDLLARGFHVFVEKPMAIRASDAEAMVRAAGEAGAVLSVGLYRRLLPVARLLRGLLDAEFLGAPIEVDIEEGGEYTWELATLSVLTREGGGGGVLIDIGTHLLDQLLFLLPGEPQVVEYQDNARGGIETDCVARLSIASRWGAVPVRMELSRTRQLRGSIRVKCERGTLELHRGDFCRVRVHGAEGQAADAVSGQSRPVAIEAVWDDERDIVGYKAFRAEFDDWLKAIAGGGSPVLSGESVVPVVKTIEACYASPKPLPEPWVDGGLVATSVLKRGSAAPPPARPRVLVTGAGGFLGCRLVECLHFGDAWDVRALVRRPASAARLARLPVDIVLADVTDRAALKSALDGCDAVVHCAVGTGWPPEAAFTVTVEGTRAIAEAALEAGVRRFVHISSMAVHGNQVPARLVETTPLDPGVGVDYGRAKFLAEQAVNDAAKRGLRAITLRPARIYGPFSRTFTTRPLQALSEGRLVLSGDAETPANMVYVDNVVEAIARALTAPESAVGEAFLINDLDQLSWREFFQFFETGSPVQVRQRVAASTRPKPGLGARWARGLREVAFSSEVRQLAKKVLWTDPLGTWPRKWWETSPGFQARVQRALRIDAAVTYRQAPPAPPDVVEFTIDPTLVVADKAVQQLGYAGAVPRAEAMELTRQWAVAARLLGVPK
jgi:predicted dehydrogenase/nucleoside-diphosphate-sugar epimerase